jgi:hypothetical protein
MRSVSALVLAAALTLIPSVRAQAGGDEGDERSPEQIAELVRQIRRNMVEVEKEMDRVEAEASQVAAENTRADIQKLIESLKGRGGQITQDIDEIVKSLRC